MMRTAVKGDTSQGVQAVDLLAKRQAAFEAQTLKTNATLAQHAKAQDESAAATRRAQQAQANQTAAHRNAAQLQVDNARRQREALQAQGQATQASLKSHLDAIEKEKAAKLAQLDLDKRSAGTQAERLKIENRAAQVRHDAALQRQQVERSVEAASAKEAQRVAAQRQQASQRYATAIRQQQVAAAAQQQKDAAAAAEAARKQAAQASAASRQSAQLTADAAKREREALEQGATLTKRNLGARLQAIEKEKVARLAQIEVERRGARSTADSLRLANQADQVRHEAFMRRRQAERGVQQQSSIGGQAGNLAALAGGAAAAAVAVDQLASRSLQLSNVQANLPFSIDKARQATKGLVSDFDLMKQAIAASRLGVAKTGEDFARLADTSTKLGVSMGGDATTSLDNLVNGLGRASTEVLDNLGITLRAEDAHKLYAGRIGKTVSELSDLEKRQAVVTIGLERGEEAARKVALQVDGMAGAWARAKVTIGNAVDALFEFDDAVAQLSREGFMLLGHNAKEADAATSSLGDGLETIARTSFAATTFGASEAGFALFGLAGGAEEAANTVERGKPQWTLLGQFLGQQGTAAERAAAGWRELAAAVDKVSAETAAKQAATWGEIGGSAERGGRTFLAGALQEFNKIEEKRTEKTGKEAAKRLELARNATRAELANALAGAQRDLQVAELRNAPIRERLALIDQVAAVERSLAEKEYTWAKTRAEQLQAEGQLAASMHAQELARREALLALEQRAKAEHNARIQAEGEGGIAALRRSQELQAANTGLGRGRVRNLLEPDRVAGAEASDEITRLQEQVRANDDLRAAETALLEQRLAGTTDYAERIQIQDQIAQLAHEAEIERIGVISAIEAKQLEEERARAAARKAITQSVLSFSLAGAQGAAMAGIGIARAEKAAAKAARESGESESAARAKARGEGLISFGQQLQGEAVGHGFQAVASFATGNPIAGAGHLAAAAALGAGGALLIARGQTLAARGGGASGASSAGGTSFGGGGSPAANGPSPGAGSPIPPSPQPGATPGRVPSPGNPMGGTANPPPRAPSQGGAKVINATFHAVTIDRGAAREIRRALQDLAANG